MRIMWNVMGFGLGFNVVVMYLKRSFEAMMEK
jgi:hypothetical protein